MDLKFIYEEKLLEETSNWAKRCPNPEVSLHRKRTGFQDADFLYCCCAALSHLEEDHQLLKLIALKS
jgi:prenyltransferase beta subunit